MSYPELNVSPRATERIRLEIKPEASKAWTSHLAIQVSGVTTLLAAAMSSSSLRDDRPEANMAPTVGLAVGALWVGATAWAAMKYRPYRKASNRLRRFPYKTKRQKLIAERMAEEEINSLARFGRNMRWFSVLSNAAASGILLSGVEGDSDAQTFASISALVALTPLFFKSHWEQVADEQEKYKKKIYAPIAMMPLLHRNNLGGWDSGLALSYQF